MGRLQAWRTLQLWSTLLAPSWSEFARMLGHSRVAAIMLTCSSLNSRRCGTLQSIVVNYDLRPGESLAAILGISPTATNGEIKAAFRSKARVLHPDVNPSPNAVHEFRRLVAAHEIITDPRRRSTWGTAPECRCGAQGKHRHAQSHPRSHSQSHPSSPRSSGLRPITYLYLAIYSCLCGTILGSL